MDELIELTPTNSDFPNIKIPNRGEEWSEFKKSELKLIKKQFTENGIKISKVGPKHLPKIDERVIIHYVTDYKEYVKVPIILYDLPLHTDDEFAGLDFIFGELSFSDDLRGKPVIIYTRKRLPKKYRYYASRSPLASLEMSLCRIWENLKYEYGTRYNEATLKYKEMESTISKNLGLHYPGTNFGQKIDIFQNILKQLNDIPKSTRYSKSNLTICNDIFALYFGFLLRLKHPNISWRVITKPSNFQRTVEFDEAKGKKMERIIEFRRGLVLGENLLLDIFEIVSDGTKNNLSLGDIFDEINLDLNNERIPKYAVEFDRLIEENIWE